MSNDVKVSVRNLTKCFGDLKVLDNISFDIKKGEFICVVGPTGCRQDNLPQPADPPDSPDLR